jgi:fatty-acyl-CoA synthase
VIAVHQRPVLVPDLWVHALGHDLSRTVVELGDRSFTAAHVRDEVSRYTQAFAAEGLVAGSPVATLTLNRPEVLFVNGACHMTGCRTTPLTAQASLDDHAHILEDAGIDTLVVEAPLAERAAALQERVPVLERILTLGPADVGTDLFARSATYTPGRLRAPRPDPGDIDRIMFTGGTTGRPKGVTGAYRSAAAVADIQMAEWQWPDPVRFLVCSPLSHAAGAFILPTLLRGGCFVVLPAFDPDEVLDAIERYRITAMMVVPTMLYTLLDHPRLSRTDLSSLQAVYYGAAAMSPVRMAEALERFGPVFFQFYGQSEAPMTVCVLRREEHDVGRVDRLRSCGRPVPWLHVALLDDDDQEVADDEPGELCVRGPIVMERYWNRPEETAQALRGGWLHTGDVACRDEDGFLTIVDRTKDMIVSGGFNVYARDVEDAIATHPDVSAVAVIGIPDEHWGEAVTAIVVLRPGAAVTADDLVAVVRARKGAVHAPKRVEFVDAIPTSPLGKPDKKALRARFWSDQDRQVH